MLTESKYFWRSHVTTMASVDLPIATEYGPETPDPPPPPPPPPPNSSTPKPEKCLACETNTTGLGIQQASPANSP